MALLVQHDSAHLSVMSLLCCLSPRIFWLNVSATSTRDLDWSLPRWFSVVALSSLDLNWTADLWTPLKVFWVAKVKDIKGRLPWVGAVNEVLGDSAYDISSSARNMTLLNDALNKCIEQAGCMARWCDGLTSHVPHASRDVCQALADRKEADLEELENRDYEKKMPACLKRVGEMLSWMWPLRMFQH